MLTAEIAILEDNLSKGNANKTVLAEYRKREAEYLNRAKDLEDVTAMRDAAKQRHDDTRKKRLDEFMAGFSAISAKLKEMYQVGGVESVWRAGADCTDDHDGWERRDRADRQHGPLLRGRGLVDHAPQEELEGDCQSVGRGENASLARAGLCASCL